MGFLDKLLKSMSGSEKVSVPDNITFRNKADRDMYMNNPRYREMKNETAALNERLKQQDELIAIVCTAREKYKSDGDIESAIASYEKAMIEADPPLRNAQSHAIFLAELYIKNGQNDKAWGYLNMLHSKDLCPLSKIRKEQAKILKKEKKHIQAIEYILLEYWNHAQECEFNYYNHNGCIKDIGPSIRALGWSFEDQEKCVSFVDYAVSLKSRSCEQTVYDLYRKFVEGKDTAGTAE